MTYEGFLRTEFKGKDIPQTVEASAACWALHNIEEAMRDFEKYSKTGALVVTPEADDDIYLSLQSAASRLRESLGIKPDYGESKPIDLSEWRVQ